MSIPLASVGNGQHNQPSSDDADDHQSPTLQEEEDELSGDEGQVGVYVAGRRRHRPAMPESDEPITPRGDEGPQIRQVHDDDDDEKNLDPDADRPEADMEEPWPETGSLLDSVGTPDNPPSIQVRCDSSTGHQSEN